jgi:hypothetical protein
MGGFADRAVPSLAGIVAAAFAAATIFADVEPFTSEAVERGVQYTMQGYPQSGGAYGFGMAIADMDRDGDQDLILLGRSNGLPGLFENDGTGHFTNRIFDSGIFAFPGASSVVCFDYDGDRDLDLFITQYMGGGGNRLYRQDAPWQFTNVTFGSGLGETLPTKGVCVADYDGDGWLDLYLANYVVPGNVDVTRNRLYRNLGTGVFARVQPGPGIESVLPSLHAHWTDVDGDSWPDLYLSNDRGPYYGPNQLWRNDHGALVDISEQSGADARLFSMGVASGDLNGDGYPDFYATNVPDPLPPLYGANPLLLSQGDGTYLEAQEEWGIAHHILSWGALFWDFDNDTDLDLYVNNQFLANTAYVNPGRPPMVNATTDLALAGTGGVSYVSIVGDLDGDGDLDLVQNNHSGNVRLYMNQEGSRRRWIRLRVEGIGANHQAAGASASLLAGGTWQWAEVILGGNSYLGQNESILHFGLGSSPRADEILVRWPNGGPTRTLRNLASNLQWTAYPPQRLGDVDGDGVVGASDWAAFQSWGLGLLVPGREMLDFDGDSMLDADDVNAFWDCASIVRGDLNGDGVVGGPDLAMLLSHWNASGSSADLDLDGVVGGVDLTILLGAWNGK